MFRPITGVSFFASRLHRFVKPQEREGSPTNISRHFVRNSVTASVACNGHCRVSLRIFGYEDFSREH